MQVDKLLISLWYIAPHNTPDTNRLIPFVCSRFWRFVDYSFVFGIKVRGWIGNSCLKLSLSQEARTFAQNEFAGENNTFEY